MPKSNATAPITVSRARRSVDQFRSGGFQPPLAHKIAKETAARSRRYLCKSTQAIWPHILPIFPILLTGVWVWVGLQHGHKLLRSNNIPYCTTLQNGMK